MNAAPASVMAPATPPFVHLDVHTEYSLVDGIATVGPLVSAVRAAEMPAVAVTERGNLFSMVKFYCAALKAGIQPIIGAEILVTGSDDGGDSSPLVALCQNQNGYRNLARVISAAYTKGQVRGIPMVERQWMADHSEGLLILSGGMDGAVGRALVEGRPERARKLLDDWLRLFPERFYIELHRLGRDHEEDYIAAALELAECCDVPVVATNKVRFLARTDFEAHEARVCIQEGRTLADRRRIQRYTEQQYLRSAAEMAALFADIPEALSNTTEIAKRCSLELKLEGNHLPRFPVPDGHSPEDWLADMADQGLRRRGEETGSADAPPAAGAEVYRDRLQIELKVIQRMGFAGYFLIVADFIRWAKEQGIPVGPGRGSGAGSLVAYVLGITDLDPIEHELLFERFLNPERVSLPDFDIDFCMEGRDRVIEYVADKYGRDRVAQIITFGTMAAKAVVRDAGRVLGHPYGFVDQLAKLVPFEVGMTLERAMDVEPALRSRYEDEEDVRTLIDLARKLEGLARNAGRHAGGVVIAPSALTDFMPLYCEQGSTGTVTQLDKDDLEAVGLVKFDFLGLRTLTIIDWAVRAVNRDRAVAGEQAIDITRIPTDDPESYALIMRGATTAVFQLESRGMKDLIRRLQPDCFDEVIALVALFRPGPLQSGMVDDFIDRKHGRSAVSYPHPELEPILKPTYGVILYQEQVMQIAQALAGYSLGEADLLRRAMGKKKAEEMAKQREVFVTGAAGRGVDQRTASYIFDLMEKFAGYGFNKSHSAAYAMVAYQTAWLKAHYPAAFMAAVLSADMDNTDRVVRFIDECSAMDITLAPPQVNECVYPFMAEGADRISYGLGSIKGVGQAAVEHVVQEREENGAYTNLFDFCRRIDGRKVNRRAMEALIRAGAMDGLGPSRAAMSLSLTQAMQAAEQYVRDRSAGQSDLFGGAVVRASDNPEFSETEEWPEELRLSGEKETLGLYLSGHPITRFESELRRMTSVPLAELRKGLAAPVIAAGFVVSLRTMNSRKGRMAALLLDDRSARMEAIVYSDVYARCRDLLVKDQLLVVEGEIVDDDYSGGITLNVNQIYDLLGARAAYAKGLHMTVNVDTVGGVAVDRLAGALEPFRGGPMPVCIHYTGKTASAPLYLGNEWRVEPSDKLLSELRAILGDEAVELRYKTGLD